MQYDRERLYRLVAHARRRRDDVAAQIILMRIGRLEPVPVRPTPAPRRAQRYGLSR